MTHVVHRICYQDNDIVITGCGAKMNLTRTEVAERDDLSLFRSRADCPNCDDTNSNPLDTRGWQLVMKMLRENKEKSSVPQSLPLLIIGVMNTGDIEGVMLTLSEQVRDRCEIVVIHGTTGMVLLPPPAPVVQ